MRNPLRINWYASYCRPRMWAQYADNHRGVCILFDKIQLLKCVKEQVNQLHIGDVYHGAVDYFDGRETPNYAEDEFSLSIADIEDENSRLVEQQIFTLQHIQAYLFRKHSDWANEAEYRILIHKAPTYERKYANIQCRNAIHTVVFGVDCPDNDWRQELSDLCEENRISYKGIRWTNGYPGDDPMIN